jgi:NADH-quinone oxidoreductase subunit M
MVNHGLTTGALFACIGLVADRYRTRDLSEMGGLWNRYPAWTLLLIVAALGSAALPGLNGFIGEFPILVGSYAARPGLTTVATLGMILGAYYLLWMLQRVAFGPTVEPAVFDSGAAGGASGPTRDRGGFGGVELGGIAPLVALIVLIGVLPAPFVERIKPPLAPLVAHLNAPPMVVEPPVLEPARRAAVEGEAVPVLGGAMPSPGPRRPGRGPVPATPAGR